jgi:hypothetical protein
MICVINKMFLAVILAAGLLLSGFVLVGLGQVVTVYEESNYGGRSQDFKENTSYLGDDFNDVISSIKVPSGYEVILYDEWNYGGKSKSFTGDNPSVEGFDDAASSLRIVPLMEATVESPVAIGAVVPTVESPVAIGAVVPTVGPAAQSESSQSQSESSPDQSTTEIVVPFASYTIDQYSSNAREMVLITLKPETPGVVPLVVGCLHFFPDGTNLRSNYREPGNPPVVNIFYYFSRFDDIVNMLEGDGDLAVVFRPGQPELSSIRSWQRTEQASRSQLPYGNAQQ